MIVHVTNPVCQRHILENDLSLKGIPRKFFEFPSASNQQTLSPPLSFGAKSPNQ
jgi:hypothetical protein